MKNFDLFQEKKIVGTALLWRLILDQIVENKMQL